VGSDLAPALPAGSAALLARAVAIGSAVTAVVGGVGGTVSFPVVGTFFGVLLGAVAGAAIGGLDGVVLIVVTTITSSRGATRLVCAATTILGWWALAAGGLIPGWWPIPGPANLLILAAIAVVSGALAPIAAFGARPIRLRRRSGEAPAAAVVKKALRYGAVAGAGVGAAAGLVLGLNYLPTAPVAVVEGAILGSVSGAFAALVAAAALIAPRLRARP
jgi:hypothetical protein